MSEATKTTIFRGAPDDWRALQAQVAQLFREMGCAAEEEHEVDTARGTVEVDVFVSDAASAPMLTYICECKHWKKNVPKTVVHAFRSVVVDSGAHAGYLISSSGFQSGAFETAANSNVELCSWNEFQALFYGRWLEAMFGRLAKRATRVFDYMDVLNDRIAGVLDSSREAADDYMRIFRKYSCFVNCNEYARMRGRHPEFPIECIDPRGDVSYQEAAVFDHPRDYFDALMPSAESALHEFESYLRSHET